MIIESNDVRRYDCSAEQRVRKMTFLENDVATFLDVLDYFEYCDTYISNVFFTKT